MFDGQLILLCLPDHEKMKLQSAKDEFFKYANDLVQNHSSKRSDHSKSGIFKNLMGEYDFFTTPYITHSGVSQTDYNISKNSENLPSSPHSSPEQPPEVI